MTVKLGATSPSRLAPRRILLPLSALSLAALACSLLSPFRSAASTDRTDLSAVADLYDETGVSLDEALSVDSIDERQHTLELMGAPDAFSLQWQELNGRLVRWEEWSYFDFESRFDFVDGELLWSLDIDPAPDGSIYAHAFDPLVFQPDLSTSDVKAMFPDLAFMEIQLEEADIPGGLLLAADQLLLGFEGDRLVYVQTFILSPNEPLTYETESRSLPPAPVAPVATAALPTGGRILLHDTFDDPARTASPIFGAEYMELSLYDGIGSLIAHHPGELVALYDSPQIADFRLAVELWPADPQPDAGYGLVFRSDAREGGLDHYYILTAEPARGLLRLHRWNLGTMTELARQPLPDLKHEPFELTVTARGPSIEVTINGLQALRLEDNDIPGPGLIGLAIYSPAPGDSVLFNELTVEALDD